MDLPLEKKVKHSCQVQKTVKKGVEVLNIQMILLNL